MGRRISLAELPAPLQVKPVRMDGILNYGDDNAYPSRMERIINGSITAKSCSNMLTRFIVGDGFNDIELNNIIVGRDEYFRPITTNHLLRKAATSIAKNNGFYFRIQYDGNKNITGIKPEQFKYCRFGLPDDNDYSGKIVIYNNWDKVRSTRKERDKFKVVDIFNKNDDIINAQIKKAGSFEKYKGQVYFKFLDDEYTYPLSPIDPVLWDADTESQISMFKNGELRRGFFLKHIIYHTEFESDEDAQDFKEKAEKFMGGDHELSVMIAEGSFDETGKLIQEENFAIQKVEQNVNDKIFDTYEKSTQNNIRKAFNAIPPLLIDYEDGKLGTTSGEALRQAADFYNSQTVELRNEVEATFKELFKYWKDSQYRDRDWTIKKLEFNGTMDNNPAAGN